MAMPSVVFRKHHLIVSYLHWLFFLFCQDVFHRLLLKAGDSPAAEASPWRLFRVFPHIFHVFEHQFGLFR